MAHKVKVGLRSGVPYANPDPCTICSDCQIVWVAADPGTKFQVEFAKNANPFSGTIFAGEFDRPAWSSACKDRPGAGVQNRYGYTLTVNGISKVLSSVIVDGGP